MASTKRKSLEAHVGRRIRARRESSEEADEEFSAAAPPKLRDGEISNFSRRDPDNESEDDGDEDATDMPSPSSPSKSPLTASISFGALAKAQATVQQPTKDTESRRNFIFKPRGDATWEDNEATERKAGRNDHRDFSRASKHAPAELSSKKAVSRKRAVVPVIEREYRDPRFEPLSGSLDESKLQKAYSFLDRYREDEMKELKAAIKRSKDEAEKEKLKREFLSMESRKKAQEWKKKEAEIIDSHRKKEKELVKQGKKPFYLKKAEQKKRLLVKRYNEFKGKQLDHVLERRRKKVEGNEKKQLPWSRRERNKGES